LFLHAVYRIALSVPYNLQLMLWRSVILELSFRPKIIV